MRSNMIVIALLTLLACTVAPAQADEPTPIARGLNQPSVNFQISGTRASEVCPGDQWMQTNPADVGLDANQLPRAREYALTGEGSGHITRGGKLVMSWGDVKQRYDLKSTTKSFGATALGLAILDGTSVQEKRPASQPNGSAMMAGPCIWSFPATIIFLCVERS